MGAFDGLAVATVTVKGTPLSATPKQGAERAVIGDTAQFRLEIVRTEIVKRRGGKPDAFIATVKVVKSTNPAHPVGSERSWFQDMSQDSAMGSIKAFASSALGLDNTNKQLMLDKGAEIQQVMEAAVTPAQVLKGKLIDVEVILVETKKINPVTKQPGEFTRHNWKVAA